MLNRTHPWIEVGDNLLLDLYTGTVLERMLHDPEKPNQDYWLIEHRCQAGVTPIFEGSFAEAQAVWFFLKKAVVPVGNTGSRIGTIPGEAPEVARPKVVIEVSGGVASVESCPDWIEVEIHDYDVEDEDEPDEPDYHLVAEDDIPPEDVDYGAWRG